MSPSGDGLFQLWGLSGPPYPLVEIPVRFPSPPSIHSGDLPLPSVRGGARSPPSTRHLEVEAHRRVFLTEQKSDPSRTSFPPWSAPSFPSFCMYSLTRGISVRGRCVAPDFQ